MLLKLFFIFSLSWSFSISYAEEGLTDAQKQQHQQIINQQKSLIKFTEGQLNNCINRNCKKTCRQTKEDQVCTGTNIPDAECTSRADLCSQQKNELEVLKKKVKDMEKALEELNKSEEDSDETEDNPDDSEDDPDANKDDSDGKSALAQTQKTRDNTALKQLVGAGATALLYKKYSACMAACSTGCGAKCMHWLIAAGLALKQTIEIGKKKKDLTNTMNGLCDDPPCEPDDTPDGGDTGSGSLAGDDTTEVKIPPQPSFCPGGLTAEECRAGIGTMMIDTECPPEEPNCNDKITPNSPPMNGGRRQDGGLDLQQLDNNSDDNSKLTAITDNLKDIFEPPGGWPDGAFDDTGDFNYDKMPASKKNEIDAVMADVNQQGQAFMESHGLTDDSAGGSDYSSQGKADDVSPAFQKMADDSRALAGLEDSPVRRRKKPTSLAEQMKNMLKKMHGGDKNGAGFLGDKSVSIGSDKVGVREDNIFHMVHRMNRKLEGNDRFISPISF